MLKTIIMAGAAFLMVTTLALAGECKTQSLEQAKIEYTVTHDGKFEVVEDPVITAAIKDAWIGARPEVTDDLAKAVKFALGRVKETPQVTNVAAIDKDGCVIITAYVGTEYIFKIIQGDGA